MRPIRRGGRRLTLSVDALVLFFEQFRPDTMIPALVQLCDFAKTHPDYAAHFQQRSMWMRADLATDLLSALFYEYYEPPFEVDELPTVTVNARRGTITIRQPEIRDEGRDYGHSGKRPPALGGPLVGGPLVDPNEPLVDPPPDLSTEGEDGESPPPFLDAFLVDAPGRRCQPRAPRRWRGAGW